MRKFHFTRGCVFEISPKITTPIRNTQSEHLNSYALSNFEA